jgi:ferredoxin, 2Fe-2S
MPTVRFLPINAAAAFTSGEIPYQGEGRPESLLDLALRVRDKVQLRHACGGICACITCHVVVEQGDENLSPMERDEEDRVYRIPGYTLHSRLACRAVVHGDVTVRIPEDGC